MFWQLTHRFNTDSDVASATCRELWIPNRGPRPTVTSELPLRGAKKIANLRRFRRQTGKKEDKVMRYRKVVGNDKSGVGEGGASRASSSDFMPPERGVGVSLRRLLQGYFSTMTGQLGAGGTGTGLIRICSSRWSTAAFNWASSPPKVAWGRLSTTISGSTPWPSMSHLPSGP